MSRNRPQKRRHASQRQQARRTAGQKVPANHANGANRKEFISFAPIRVIRGLTATFPLASLASLAVKFEMLRSPNSHLAEVGEGN